MVLRFLSRSFADGAIGSIATSTDVSFVLVELACCLCSRSPAFSAQRAPLFRLLFGGGVAFSTTGPDRPWENSVVVLERDMRT